MIDYISTRDPKASPQNFEQVLLNGLAPDGGLYVPKHWPQIDIEALKGKSYIEIAQAIITPFIEGTIPLEDFKAILHETYSAPIFRHKDITPLHHLKGYENGNIYIMEQFHGPTIAFKDVALQLLGRLFNYVLDKNDERITIIGATSGDTGSAAIEGCKSCDRINMFILHPKGRVSDVQRKQMTTIHAPNIHNIALEGTFDDCQNMVKAMFNDPTFREDINLAAINSINWARIMAQIVYYFTAAIKQGAPDKEISFIIPTGNFGNVFAACAARQMGLPIKILGISTNQNDILTRFIQTGEMRIEDPRATLSPSMDIQISSNIERYLFDLLGRDSDKLTAFMEEFKTHGKVTLDKQLTDKVQKEFKATSTDDTETLALIKECYDKTDYILDPHTAVGLKNAKSIAAQTKGDVILLATAHPAKFPDAVESAIGLRPALPEHLSDLFQREEKMSLHPNDLETIQNFVKEKIKS